MQALILAMDCFTFQSVANQCWAVNGPGIASALILEYTRFIHRHPLPRRFQGSGEILYNGSAWEKPSPRPAATPLPEGEGKMSRS